VLSSLSTLSKALSIQVNKLNTAGTKDKRAVTVQWCTGYKITKEQLTAFNAKQKRYYRDSTSNLVVVGNMSYVDAPLSLGALQGNRFTIVLRNLAIGNTKQDTTTTSTAASNKVTITRI
jgi:TruD family tRNA pseudouridine synthase